MKKELESKIGNKLFNRPLINMLHTLDLIQLISKCLTIFKVNQSPMVFEARILIPISSNIVPKLTNPYLSEISAARFLCFKFPLAPLNFSLARETDKQKKAEQFCKTLIN